MNGRAVRVVAEVEHDHHVRVRHLGDGLRLALEARLELGVVGDLRDHDLEGHVAVEHRVAGQVDLAHGALAERTLDLVLADAARQLPLDRLRWIAGLSHSDVSGATTPLCLRRGGYCVLPVTVKCARRFFCQHSSVEAWQAGTSLPYETVLSRLAGTPSDTR